ncbi:MAG TPA: hypothetical protein VEW42_06175 [Candidatus Eisenbacteria bacterium]|nr:hypothetical protein [Candidatus Eisenbacteria bacterium]
MITLIHGEDITASRNFYFDAKKKSVDAITLDGTAITLTDLQQALSGSDLFGVKKDIFIENLISKRKSIKDIEQFVDIITDSNAETVLWESKELTPKQVGLFGKAAVRLFKIPSTIFAFLDGIRPNNGKQLIELFHKTLEDKDPEFVLFMLQRQIRTLLALSSSSEESESRSATFISELSRLAPWQKGKVEKQAGLFSTQQLLDVHDKLFQLELDMKTGGLTLPLAESIDMLLLSI